jgi:hypothetical protein
MHSAKICFVEPTSTKLDVPESETGGSGISKGSYNLGETTTTKHVDWRTPLIHYLENPGHVINT